MIIADTKFEFGFDVESGDLTLIDEVGTPDSSRFWPATSTSPGVRSHRSTSSSFGTGWTPPDGTMSRRRPPSLRT